MHQIPAEALILGVPCTSGTFIWRRFLPWIEGTLSTKRGARGRMEGRQRFANFWTCDYFIEATAQPHASTKMLIGYRIYQWDVRTVKSISGPTC